MRMSWRASSLAITERTKGSSVLRYDTYTVAMRPPVAQGAGGGYSNTRAVGGPGRNGSGHLPVALPSMRTQRAQRRFGQGRLLARAQVGRDVGRLPHSRDGRGDRGVVQDEPQSKIGERAARGHDGTQPVDARERLGQPVGPEVEVAPVAFRPARVERHRAREAPLLAGDARDHRDLTLEARREELVF